MYIAQNAKKFHYSGNFIAEKLIKISPIIYLCKIYTSNLQSWTKNKTRRQKWSYTFDSACIRWN